MIGSIVNVASMACTAYVRLHAYGPGQAGVFAMIGQLARRAGVRVNAIAPAYTLIKALQAMIDEDEPDPA